LAESSGETAKTINAQVQFFENWQINNLLR
jgi:hypothetical protein